MAHVQDRREQGRGWVARYTGPDGRERSKAFERKADAEAWITGQEGRKLRGEWIDPSLGKRTFSAWVGEWERSIVDLRDSTLSRDLGVVRNHLSPRFGPLPLSRITLTDAQAFVAELQTAGRLAPASVRKVGAILSKIMSEAARAGYIAGSPCRGLRLPPEGQREMVFITAEEVEGLADAMRPDHYRPLVFTAAYAGLRWGELAGLRIDRLDPLRRTIRVEEQLTEVSGAMRPGPPKTAAGRRTVRLPRFLADMLGEHLSAGAVQRTGLVFPSVEGTPMRSSNFRRRVWLPALRRVGLVLRFHDLRHTAVAFAIAQGGHPKAIQERMGHSSINVTLDRYGHLFPALDEQIADGLETLRSTVSQTGRRRDEAGTRALRADAVGAESGR